MNNSPQLSVIIPAYNSELYLAEAIESVLAQKYQPLEIIIVDDGSTDSTKRVATSFRNVQYIYQGNQGPASARNTGLSLAQGDIITFLDSDDLWSDNKLELQLKRLSVTPSVEIVLGYTQRVRLTISCDGEPEFKSYLNPQPMLSLGSALIRKTVFDKVGLFEKSLLFADDIDWFLRAREKGIRFVIHHDITQYYRKHTHNITHQRQLDLKYQIKVYKRSLDRRRYENDGTIRSLKNWSEFYETKDVNGESTLEG